MKSTKIPQTPPLLALLLTAALVGCGGGGGDTLNVGGQVASSAVTLEGSVLKGKLVNAKVSVYKVNADGTKGDLLTAVTTGDAGQYKVTFTGYSGVVLVEVTATTETTMYDEATDSTIKPAANFLLRASVQPIAGAAATSLQVNPFTEQSTAAALAKSGKLSADNVAYANSATAEVLTFNPLNTAAQFDEAGKTPKNPLAAALVAVSALAKEGSLGCNRGDQADKVACVIKEISAKGVGDAAVKLPFQAQFDAVNNAANLPVVSLGTLTSSGTVLAATPLEQTKAFITTLRSNAKALDAADLSLQSELQAVSADLKNRVSPVGAQSIAALDLAQKAAQFYADVITNPSAAFVASRGFGDINRFFFTNATFPTSIASQAGCGFYSDTNYLVRATSKADAKYVACGTQEQFVGAVDQATGAQAACTVIGQHCLSGWSIRVRLHPDAAVPNKFSVYTQTRESQKLLPAGVKQGVPTVFTENRVLSGAAFPGNASVLTLQRNSAGKVFAFDLVGELSPAFERTVGVSTQRVLTGTTVAVRTLPGAITVIGDKNVVNLAAALTSTATSNKLAVKGFAEVVKAGVVDTRLELLEGSYAIAEVPAVINIGNDQLSERLQEVALKFKASTANSVLVGDLTANAFQSDSSGTSRIPTAVAFTGSVQRKGASFFDGSVKLEVLNYTAFNDSRLSSASNALSSRVSFAGKVTIATRPVLSVTLSLADKDMGAVSETSLSGQYVQGNTTVNLSGLDTAQGNVLTLETPAGLKMVLDRSKTIYPLTFNGQAVGQFAIGSDRLTYTDSTFEQF